MKIDEFIRVYGNSNGISRNMYGGSHDLSIDSRNPRGYKITKPSCTVACSPVLMHCKGDNPQGVY